MIVNLPVIHVSKVKVKVKVFMLDLKASVLARFPLSATHNGCLEYQ